MIHGALDYRVPDGHGLEVFNMLQQRGVTEPARLLPEREPLDPEAAELTLLVPGRSGSWLKEFIGEGPDGAPKAAAGAAQ